MTVDDGVAAGFTFRALTLTTMPAGHEVSVVVPRRETVAKLAVALHLLTTSALEQNRAPDLGGLRHLLHGDAVELSLILRGGSAVPSRSAAGPVGDVGS